MNTKSQCEAIEKHLRSGKSLTALEALQKFQCLRLAARCYELKQRGMEIKTYTTRVGRGKEAKRVSVYYALRGRAA